MSKSSDKKRGYKLSTDDKVFGDRKILTLTSYIDKRLSIPEYNLFVYLCDRIFKFPIVNEFNDMEIINDLECPDSGVNNCLRVLADLSRGRPPTDKEHKLAARNTRNALIEHMKECRDAGDNGAILYENVYVN